ncbi:hypothetical protein Tco_0465905 [Tanacetum coccineum]
MDHDSAHMVAVSKVPMLKLGILNEHQLKFKSIKDAKLLLEAVEKRFGRNAATKKTQRNFLKKQYENFTAPSLEMLDQTFDRLQKLMSQLELLDEKFSQEDVNQKLLRSLPPEWNTHAVVWRNKGELETMRMDDLYNNLKVYEPEVKGMSSSSSSTPMETQKPLLKDEDGEEVDVHMYRLMIGSLMYLTSSRPDIMFAVCACARYQVNLKVSHLHAVKRIFRYLKGQPKLGLWYPKDSSFDLVAYTDSDYAGASLDRKSTTGGCQFLRCRLISWQCKKQTMVANSITEAEYVAASSCYGQVLWIQNQLLDYGYNFMHTKIFIDNNNTYNMVAFLSKPTESEGFEQIVDFLNAQPIRYALTVNLTIYISCIEQFWSTGVVKTINGEVQLHALVDGKKVIIFEASVRRDLKLEDEKDKVVYKELGDSLVRAATIASILEVEQDSGSITKTRSKATPNESSPLEPTFNGGNLQQKVLDLDKTKTTQANEISNLKRRVKKLEHKKRSKTHGLKRLYKVGLSARVESSGDEEDLGKDASKHGRRINVIDEDEDITLVNDDADKEMFDGNTLNGEEVFFAGQNENVIEEIVDAAQVSTAATIVIITTEEITLAQALEALKTSKPKVKGIVLQELGESTTISSKVLSQDKGKGILVEPKKPLKKKDKLKLNEEIALKLQAEIDEEERIARAKEEKINEANIAWDEIQAKVDADY